MRCPLLWLCVVTAGCSFKVAGVSTPPIASDLSSVIAEKPMDLALVDESISSPSVDLLLSADLRRLLDMAAPRDMAIGLQLSHVPQHYIGDGTCDLAPTASIDTSGLSIDGVTAPAGCLFTTDSEGGQLEVAVLAVNSFTVAGTVRVTGSRPLVIVAGATIAIAGLLDAGASATTPGAGGGTAEQGTSTGKDGEHAGTYADSGGGGGGYSSAGSNGGAATWMGASAAAGMAGIAFAGDLSVALPGGASGGKLSAEKCSAGIANGGGGAGGGSIQLSARSSITVGGNVNAGGGGGLGGCVNGTKDQGSGGGAGAGGALWLESPVVKISGGLWANGGSGGGAAEGLIGANGTVGGNGNDGPQSTIPAVGGTSPGMNAGGGGSGGTGSGASAASGQAPGVATAAPSGTTANAGGGGGSAGTITIRYKGSANVSANVSPTPRLDPTVP